MAHVKIIIRYTKKVIYFLHVGAGWITFFRGLYEPLLQLMTKPSQLVTKW